MSVKTYRLLSHVSKAQQTVNSFLKDFYLFFPFVISFIRRKTADEKSTVLGNFLSFALFSVSATLKCVAR